MEDRWGPGPDDTIARLGNKCVAHAGSRFTPKPSSLYAEGVVVNSRSVEERSDDTTGERRGQLATLKESSWA
jgi:hypothetical protein